MVTTSPNFNKNKLSELSALELEIMDIVWDLGDCSSAEVIAACRRKRPLADTTVRTVLSNIRKKGYLEPVPTIERGFRLRPVVSREAVARRALKQLLATLFKNSPRQAIAFLLDEKMTAGEMQEIRRMIEAHKDK